MYRDVLYADLAGALIGDVQGCTVCRFRLKRLLLVQEQKSVMYTDVLYADFAGAKIGNAAIAKKDN